MTQHFLREFHFGFLLEHQRAYQGQEQIDAMVVTGTRSRPRERQMIVDGKKCSRDVISHNSDIHRLLDEYRG